MGSGGILWGLLLALVGLDFGLGLISLCSEDSESRGAGRLGLRREFFRSEHWLFVKSALDGLAPLTHELTFQPVSPLNLPS